MSNRIFEILIRRNKFELDEKRRELAILLGKKDQLDQNIKAIINKQNDEWQTMHSIPEYRLELTNYMRLCHQKIAQLKLDIDKIMPEIEQANEAVREAFSEVSKMEIALEARIEAENEEIRIKEANELDEIASQLHTRIRRD